jgi:hypothetical protein
MSHTTQGTLLLDKLGIAYTLHPYEYDPAARALASMPRSRSASIRARPSRR